MANKPEDKQEGKATGEGRHSMLPLIIALVAMPALAYATTTFILLPKLQTAVGVTATGNEHAAADKGLGGGGHGSGHGDAGHGGDGGGPGDGGNTFDLGKVLVNVGGSAGTRYLVANYTLKGKAADFGARLEASKPQLLDIAGSVMSSKSLIDLEQPGARNLIRNELITSFNNALGSPLVKEVYITEFAIQ